MANEIQENTLVKDKYYEELREMTLKIMDAEEQNFGERVIEARRDYFSKMWRDAFIELNEEYLKTIPEVIENLNNGWLSLKDIVEDLENCGFNWENHLLYYPCGIDGENLNCSAMNCLSKLKNMINDEEEALEESFEDW